MICALRRYAPALALAACALWAALDGSRPAAVLWLVIIAASLMVQAHELRERRRDRH